MLELTRTSPGSMRVMNLNGRWFIGSCDKALLGTIQSFLLCKQLNFEYYACRKLMEGVTHCSSDYSKYPFVAVYSSHEKLSIGYLSWFDSSPEKLHHIKRTEFPGLVASLLRMYNDGVNAKSLQTNPAWPDLSTILG